MIRKIENLISYCYYSLFFIVPFALHPKTSELFEFNKIVLTYIFTIFITFLWLIKIALSGKSNFKKTPIDIFLILFLLSQVVSTLLSVEIRTSMLGYYSRFHQGLTSTVSYLLLYWAYVSNMNREKTKKAIYFLLSSAFLISIWAIFEHFGKSFTCLLIPEYGNFDVSCWIQDVATRVFATFGQPNWLAAWLAAIIPLTWSWALISVDKNQKPASQNNILYKVATGVTLSTILFLALLFTKSRSGLLGLVVAALVYWLWTLVKYLKDRHSSKVVRQSNKHILYVFLSIVISFLISITIFGTPWTSSLEKILNKETSNVRSDVPVSAPALEVGGTESGQIRKIVWKGAFEIWKNYPIFGSGVETFALSYYKHRPVEHNLVSEWNFLYNKAHNEYLNFAATTGTVGLVSYLSLIGAIIYLFIKLLKAEGLNTKNDTGNPKYKNEKTSDNNHKFENYAYILALFSGFVSILITNFFGFSVVAVAILFFLFPGIAVTLVQQGTNNKEKSDIVGKLTNSQVTLIFFALCFLLFALSSIGKYWRADYHFAKGKLENDSGMFSQSRNTLLKAIDLSPNESMFWDELADSTGSLALFYAENGDANTSLQIANNAILESDKAASLSPTSVILKKTRVRMLSNLSAINPNYMSLAKKTLLEASELAPTDAHISYNLAIIYFRSGDMENFLENLKKTIVMKPNYKEAHYALAQYYTHEGEEDLAKKELIYILENIDDDPVVQKELDDLENKTD